jgi:hypothetical protein
LFSLFFQGYLTLIIILQYQTNCIFYLYYFSFLFPDNVVEWSVSWSKISVIFKPIVSFLVLCSQTSINSLFWTPFGRVNIAIRRLASENISHHMVVISKLIFRDLWEYSLVLPGINIVFGASSPRSLST